MARGEIAGGPGRLSNVVFMGMGEPMANYKAVIGAVRRMVDAGARRPRHVGAQHHRQHRRPRAAHEAARRRGHPRHARPVAARTRRRAAQRRSCPINTRWSVAEAVEAAWEYARTTERRVSIEYAMIKDINDQALARRPAGRRAAVVRRLGLGARQPHPAQPHAGLDVDRVASRGRARVRPSARSPRASRRPSATPAAATSTAPAASSPLSMSDSDALPRASLLATDLDGTLLRSDGTALGPYPSRRSPRPRRPAYPRCS